MTNMLRRQRAPRRLAHLLQLVPKKLFKLHKHMHKEASAIACKHYTDDHQVSFDEHGPLTAQTERCYLPTLQA